MNINVPEEVELYIEAAIAAGKFSSFDEVVCVAVELLRQQDGACPPGSEKRQGGQWRGQVKIASDFDELPDDLAEPFGL